MVGEISQNLRKAAEWFFMVDEMTGRHSAVGNHFQRPTDVVRRVMESSFASDFRVVQEVRIETNSSAGRTSAKEIDRAALADELRREFPGLRMTDGFYHDISATSARTSVHFRNHSGIIAHKDTFSGAEQNGAIHLLKTPRYSNDASAEGPLLRAGQTSGR